MYAFESKVRYSEVGEDTRMTLYSVLNYFQDCSVFHSESVGRGTAVQEELGRAWVLTGWQIEFRRAADLGESIRISTWPHGFRGFVGERNFLMETLDGEVLACADSSWAYIDVKTGHPVKASEEERAAYPVEEKLDMKPLGRRIRIPAFPPVSRRSPDSRSGCPVSNHHVNNAQYIRLSQEYIPADFQVQRLRAEYKRQAVLGDQIFPMVSKTEDSYVVALCNEEKEPYAVVEFS